MADIKKILTRVKDYVTQEDNLEKTRAENAEETLQNNINAEEQARIAAINALDLAQVGSAGNYIKFVSQTDGQVAAQKQAFDTDMANATDDNAPTTKNVKDYVDNTIDSLDKAEVGEDGKYIKKIKEDNGIITATLKEFDTLIDNSADNTNTPTTKAVKDYADAETARATAAEQIIATNLANEVQNRIADVDVEEARAKAAEQILDATIKALDFTQIGQDGRYLKTIKQVDGQITATVNTFDTNLQNADDTNAPTSLAVKDYVDDADTTLQHNIDTENSRALLAESNLTNNLATEVNDRATADSTLQSNITAEANTRATADTALANRITTLENSTAVADEQARAIAAETALGARINALDLPTTGSAGSYIKTVTQADGQLRATVQQFDIDLTSITNNNAPTTKLVDDTYSKILETVTDLSLSLDTTTYILTINLKNRAGAVVAQDTVDLPIESLVTTASYDAANKKIILTLKSGATIDVPVATLISGLQAEITAQNKLSSDLVDDTNKTHKFATAAQLTQISTNQNAIAAIKDGNSIDSFRDVEDALALKANQATTYTKTESDNLLSGKVDKVTGYALSKNDYSDAEKLKVTENTAARHSHANKNLLDSYDQSNADLTDAVTKKHDHSNKALLDTYTQTEADIAAAVTQKHTHSNKAILDATTASFTTALETYLTSTPLAVDYDTTNHLLYKTTTAGNTTTIVGLSTLVHDAGLDDAEHTANKATAWVGESDVSYIDDSHYPTTKLMYDTLETMNNNIEELIESATNILTINVADANVSEGYITAEEYNKINERTIIKFNYTGTPSALATHLCFQYSGQLLGLSKMFACITDDDFTLFAVSTSPETSGTYTGLYHWGKDTTASDLAHAVKYDQDNEFDSYHKNTFKGETEFQDTMTIKSQIDLTTNGYITGGYILSNIPTVNYRAITQLDDIADAIWNPKKAYAAGNIIFYNRALYICEDDVSASNAGNTNPADDAAHWTKLFTN